MLDSHVYRMLTTGDSFVAVPASGDNKAGAAPRPR